MGNCGSKKAEKTVVEPEEPKPSAVPEEPVEEEPVATEKPSPEAEAEPAPTEEEAEAPVAEAEPEASTVAELPTEEDKNIFAKIGDFVKNAFSAREDPDPVVSKGLPDVNVWHPQSEMEVQGIVRQARAEGKKVRVVGSGHSVWDAVVPAGFAQTGDGDWLIVFDNMRELAMDGTRVRAQAGSNLGVSPRLPHFEPITTDAALAPSAPNLTRPFSWEESLCYFLDQQGRALPDLGGISHQTVAGFLSTGSSGGTTQYSLLDYVERLRIVDGKGDVHDVGLGDDLFHAAGVGMGLCGILTEVTINTIDRFNIRGTELTASAASHPDVDFFSTGTPGPEGKPRPALRTFFEEDRYTRLMWWPQKGFERLVVWQATAEAPADDFEAYPYVEMKPLDQVGASLLYTLLGNVGQADAIDDYLQVVKKRDPQGSVVKGLRDALAKVDVAEAALRDEMKGALTATDDHKGWLEKLGHDAEKLVGEDWHTQLFERVATVLDDLLAGAINSEALAGLSWLLDKLAPYIIGPVLGKFIPDGVNDINGKPFFADSWYRGLPMDNQIDDLILPTWFTEIWIPYSAEGGELEKTIAVLKEHLRGDGSYSSAYEATGAYCIEIYAARRGDTFWLNPATGDENVLRIDIFWFGRNEADPVATFFPQFWNLLREQGIGYRLHWGKFKPPGQGAGADGLNDLTRPYGDAFRRFEAVREAYDPDGVFLSPYWASHLGI